MDWLKQGFLIIFDFLTKYAVGITLVLTLFAGAIKFWQFINIQTADARQREFENYHVLIERIVVDRNEIGGRPFLDVQIASVYELKNFPRYYPVTKLILERLKNRLKDLPEQKDLVAEVDEVIRLIERR